MFSANENLLLRQHKRQVVGWVEATMPEKLVEEVGVNVMVMQVACQDPGCVPIETAIIIVFPNLTTRKTRSSSSEDTTTQKPSTDVLFLPGLPESKPGGSFKTKILKPMDQVTQDDVLEVLPPAFEGGRRSLERLYRQARDATLAQITQLYGGGSTCDSSSKDDDDIQSRRLLAEYLQTCLQDYIDNSCVPPEWGQDFPVKNTRISEQEGVPASDITELALSTENIILQRPLDEDNFVLSTTSASTTPTSGNHLIASSSIVAHSSQPPRPRRQQPPARLLAASSSSSSLLLSRLAEQREHAPGIRRAGCPCCEPDSPANIIMTGNNSQWML
jgi:hypothetical protein